VVVKESRVPDDVIVLVILVVFYAEKRTEHFCSC
jgi:hypothetical protein